MSEACEKHGKVGSLAMRVVLYLIYVEKDLMAVYSIFFKVEKCEIMEKVNKYNKN